MRARVGGFQTGPPRLMEPELQEDVVGFERGIGGEFAAPEALRRLLRGEGHRALHGRRDSSRCDARGGPALAAA